MSRRISHVVRPGEYLAQIAARYGVDADVIWNDEKNRTVREARGNPNVLCPGDLLFIAVPANSGVHLVASVENPYTATIPTTAVHLALRGLDGPAKNVTVLVTGLDREPRRLTTDAQGHLEILDVPVTTRSLTLASEDGEMRLELRIGHLDPVDVSTGIAGRLRNLGFASIASFQEAYNLEVTGLVDDDTRRALAREHGC